MTSHEPTNYAASLEKLGDVHYDLNAHADAARMYQESLDSWLEFMGQGDITVLKCRRKLAHAYSYSGSSSQVISVLDGHLEKFDTCYGPSSSEKQAVLLCLGRAQRITGQFNDARRRLEQALENSEKMTTLDKLNNCMIYFELALLHSSTDERSVSKEYFLKIRDIYYSSLSRSTQSRSVMLARCHFGLAEIDIASSEYEDAKGNLLNALSIFNRINEHNDEEKVTSLELLVSLHEKAEVDFNYLSHAIYGLNQVFRQPLRHLELINRIKPAATTILNLAVFNQKYERLSYNQRASAALSLSYLRSTEHDFDTALKALKLVSNSYRTSYQRKLPYYITEVDKRIAEIHKKTKEVNLAIEHLKRTIVFYQGSTKAKPTTITKFESLLAEIEADLDESDKRQQECV